jgi:uncharacterized protein YrrD
MFKGRDVIGKPIISYAEGEKFDVVEDLIFDQESNRLLGILVHESGWFKPAQVLLLKDVQAIGVDAVITASQDAIANANQVPAVSHILEHNTILKGTRILTMDGRDLGVIVDLYFDEQTGNIEGYEVSGGLFADAYSGRSFVPAIQTLKIGRDVAFVPTQTAQMMAEQVGGFRAAMQTISNQFQETAQATGDQLQDFSHFASEKVQETAQVTGDRLHDLERSTTSSITNIIIDPVEQKAFVIGKTVDHDVVTPDGESLALMGQPVTQEIVDAADALGMLDELYRATGGNWSVPLGARLGNAVAGFTVEQTEGRRVRHLVRNEEGSIIAAPGQIVTPQVIERAKASHREQVLMQAVGLSVGAAFQDSTSSALTLAGDHLQANAHRTGEQLQSGARDFWTQAKEITNEIQHHYTQVLETNRIKGALGRPVARVILDQQDHVILNIGELITHQAIASARQAQVLDLLLNSVYHAKPQLSLDNFRAPQTGTAAL